MPAARYWRAIGLQSIAGGALELSAFNLYLAGSRVDAAATLTCTFPPTTGAVADLQDNDTASVCRWLDVSAPGFALVWDFGVSGAQDVAAVRLGSGAGVPEFLERLTLQFSSDGVVWTGAGSVQGLLWPGANTLQIAPPDGDYYYPQTTLLLHCDGTNGSTVFTDTSYAPRTLLRNGDVKISTGQSLVGGACAEFDGSGDYLTVTNMPVPGNSDFCLETVVRVPTLPPAGSVRMLLKSRGNFNFELTSTGGIGLYLFSGSLYAAGGSIAPNAVYDIALLRRGGTFYGYINGVQVFILASAVNFGGAYLDIGYDVDVPARAYLGWMDEIRFVFGSPRYFGNYTPRSAPGGHSQVGAVSGTSATRPRLTPVALHLSGGMAGTTGTVLVPPSLQHDLQDWGQHRIYGTVHLDATPVDMPLRRRVQLYNQRDRRLIRELWSDATTGAYSFDGIRGGDGTRYFVAAFDHTQDKRAVIADNLTPEVMP